MAEAAVLLAEGKREAALEAVRRARPVWGGLTGSSREPVVELLDSFEAAATG